MSTGTLYAIVLGGCAVAIIGAVVGMQFLSKPPPPPPPPPPVVLDQPVTPIRYTPEYFKTIVDKDAAALKLPPPDLKTLAQPLVYASELPEPKRLKGAGEAFETAHLKLRTLIVKEWATTEAGQSFRFDHIALEITNKSAVPVAYHIPTELIGATRCKAKASLQHNALVLRPGETLRRTECIYQNGSFLLLKAVEVVELSPLSLYYVERINPAPPFYDSRTFTGHVVDKAIRACQFIPWRDIEADVQKGAGWGDFLDFYARHNCSEYSFITGYRRWTAAGTLPAHP